VERGPAEAAVERAPAVAAVERGPAEAAVERAPAVAAAEREPAAVAPAETGLVWLPEVTAALLAAAPVVAARDLPDAAWTEPEVALLVVVAFPKFPGC
jgi:hypothetical protein